ncbi:polysaccharide pyruvyl transferase family protein [Novosphingobium soli]|uniref:Polysaccharide pyruvyl transferase family protein n=1 Tax=Novosphingobium soli TaxID=574956 RepID=A0ABV6CXZ7_9SPHN
MPERLNGGNLVGGGALASLTAAFRPHAGRRFALLDFPDHPNVGDSAIWIGELALFREAGGAAPAYVSAFHNLDDADLRAAVPEGPIFLHGGGNFGDVWNHHQDFREGVIARFRDRPIIQLPQSIHFRDPARIAQAARVIAAHPDFTLLVRDLPSLKLAEQQFDCTVRLCPDSALAIGSVRPAPARCEVLALLRTDRESAGALRTPPGVPVEDWLIEETGPVRRAKAAAAIGAWTSGRPRLARVRAYEAAARHRLERGLGQIARGRALVTDRLHVHILALLLGRPHAVIDNSYGKIGRFLDAFTGGSPLVHRATSLDAALAWAQAAATAQEAA